MLWFFMYIGVNFCLVVKCAVVVCLAVKCVVVVYVYWCDLLFSSKMCCVSLCILV